MSSFQPRYGFFAAAWLVVHIFSTQPARSAWCRSGRDTVPEHKNRPRLDGISLGMDPSGRPTSRYRGKRQRERTKHNKNPLKNSDPWKSKSLQFPVVLVWQWWIFWLRCAFFFGFRFRTCYTSRGVEGWRRLLIFEKITPITLEMVYFWSNFCSETCELVFGVWGFLLFFKKRKKEWIEFRCNTLINHLVVAIRKCK